MRILFAGTPEIAATCLQAITNTQHEVVAVLTQPDARGKRGNQLIPSPVATLAEQLNIKTFKPKKVSDEDFQYSLSQVDFDVAIVVAYGQIIPSSVLNLAPSGFYNLHFSLLPKYRGAAPVQRAIENGESQSGISIFKLAAQMDAGDLALSVAKPITREITAGEYLNQLAMLGAEILPAFLDQLAKQQIQLERQDPTMASYAAKIHPREGLLAPGVLADFSTPEQLENKIRSLTPNPGAYFYLNNQKIKVLEIAYGTPSAANLDPAAPAGTLGVSKKHIFLYTKTGAVEIKTVMPAGKKLMAASDWARGQRLPAYTLIDEVNSPKQIEGSK